MKKNYVKKNDIILIAAAFAAAVFIFLCINIFSGSDGGSVTVEVNGALVAELPLDENTSFDVELDGEITNTLVITDGKANMIYADCPDQICAKHKSISKNNESIICLPNRVIVTVVSDKDSDVDGVAK